MNPVYRTLSPLINSPRNELARDLLMLCKNDSLNEEERFEKAKQLLDQGADVNFAKHNLNGWPPLFWAAKFGPPKLYFLLIDRGANIIVGENQVTLLHASLCGAKESLPIIKHVLSLGIDINAQDGDGQTPLHWACKEDTAESRAQIQYLIANGASLTIKDSEDLTPIDVARQHTRNDLAEWLTSMAK
jgi:ankyrin repeat protein